MACGALFFGCGGGKAANPEEAAVPEGTITISSGAQPTTSAGAGSSAVTPVPVKPASEIPVITNLTQEPSQPAPDVTPPVVSVVGTYLTNVPVVISASADEDVIWEWSIEDGPAGAQLATPGNSESMFSAISDGVYRIKVKASDRSGNIGELSVTLTWDATTPEITGNSAYLTNAPVDLVASSDENVSWLWSIVSGPAGSALTAPDANQTSFSALVDGTYEVRATATDAAGNRSDLTVTVEWDTTPPTVAAGPDIVARQPVTVGATAVAFQTAGWSQVSGPAALIFSDTGIMQPQVSATVDGTYVLRLTATDAAGNVATDELALLWDTTPPTVNAGPDILANQPVAVAAAAAEFQSVLWSQVSGPGVLTFSDTGILQPQVSAAADGTYVLRLTATDAAGNAATDELILRWDTTAPVIDSFPLAAAASDGYLSAAELASSAATTSGVTANEAVSSRYAVIADGGLCDAAVTFQADLPLSNDPGFAPDGAYRLCSEVTDEIGYISYAQTAVILSDSVAPAATAADLPLALNRDDSLNISVAGTDVSHYRHKLGLSAATDCADTSGYGAVTPVSQRITDSLSSRPNDNLKICIIGLDLAGNEQLAATAFEHSWITDRVPPSAPVSSEIISLGNGSRYRWQPGSGDTTSYIAVRRAGTAVNFAPVSGQAYLTGDTPDSGEHVISYSGTDSRQIDTGLTAGITYYYALHAVDAAGNVSAPAKFSVDAAEVVPFNVASGFNNIVRTIFRASSGHIYIGGDFTTYINYKANRLIRLNSDYSIDTTFSIGSGFNGSVYALAEDGDGNIVAAGSFTTYKGVAANRIIKIDANGVTVSGFNIGTGLNGTVNALVTDNDTASIFVGGAFTTYKGVTYNRIVKILADGSADPAHSPWARDLTIRFLLWTGTPRTTCSTWVGSLRLTRV